jgi:hypothetical protein
MLRPFIFSTLTALTPMSVLIANSDCQNMAPEEKEECIHQAPLNNQTPKVNPPVEDDDHVEHFLNQRPYIISLETGFELGVGSNGSDFGHYLRIDNGAVYNLIKSGAITGLDDPNANQQYQGGRTLGYHLEDVTGLSLNNHLKDDQRIHHIVLIPFTGKTQIFPLFDNHPELSVAPIEYLYQNSRSFFAIKPGNVTLDFNNWKELEFAKITFGSIKEANYRLDYTFALSPSGGLLNRNHKKIPYARIQLLAATHHKNHSFFFDGSSQADQEGHTKNSAHIEYWFRITCALEGGDCTHWYDTKSKGFHPLQVGGGVEANYENKTGYEVITNIGLRYQF